MKQDILTRFPWPWLPTLALVIFFLFFIGLIIQVSRKNNRKLFSMAEVLPLHDGERRKEQL